MEDRFLTDIETYLDNSSIDDPINLEGWEEVVEEIHAKTGYDRLFSRELLRTFFTIIRLELVNGGDVHIDDVGYMYRSKRGIKWKTRKKLKTMLKEFAYSAQE